jgi:hypothetical protein
MRKLFKAEALPVRLGGDVALEDELAWASSAKHLVPSNSANDPVRS